MDMPGPTAAGKAMRPTGLVVVLSIMVALIAAPTVCAADTRPADAIPVRLQLKWRHQFQFAGFYAALEKGYYREAGFAVTIIPETPSVAPVEPALTGQS